MTLGEVRGGDVMIVWGDWALGVFLLGLGTQAFPDSLPHFTTVARPGAMHLTFIAHFSMLVRDHFVCE